MSINLEGNYLMKIIFLIFLSLSLSSCLKSEINPETQLNVNNKQETKKLSFPSVIDLRNQIIVDTSDVEYGRLKLVDNQSKKTLFQGNIQLLKKNNSIPIQGSVPKEVTVSLEKDNSKQVKVVRLSGNNLKI